MSLSASAQREISARWATTANEIATAAMATSVQKPAPAWPSRRSRRTLKTVAPTASAWIRIVHANTPAPTASGAASAM